MMVHAGREDLPSAGVGYERVSGAPPDEAAKLSRSERTLLSLNAACRYTYCTMTSALGLKKLGAMLMVRADGSARGARARAPRGRRARGPARFVVTGRR